MGWYSIQHHPTRPSRTRLFFRAGVHIITQSTSIASGEVSWSSPSNSGRKKSLASHTAPPSPSPNPKALAIVLHLDVSCWSIRPPVIRREEVEQPGIRPNWTWRCAAVLGVLPQTALWTVPWVSQPPPALPWGVAKPNGTCQPVGLA